MFPYFYPTTVAIIDDDLRFLESFDELLRREFIVRRFANPQLGLNHLVGADAEHLSRIARLGAYATSHNSPADEFDRLQILLSSYIGQLRGYPNRFETVSVAIVDLNMPGVDGLMICRALRRRPVRTILLTGNASEKVALSAFNEGLIDRFVSKHEPDLMTIIASHVRDLQNAYFRRVTTTIKDTLALQCLRFMTDGAFLRFFADACAEHRIVEYYLKADPPGVELIRSDGQTVILMVLDDQEVHRRIAAARDAGGPPEMLAKMESGEIVTHFPSEGGYYAPNFRDHWPRYSFPATPVVGATRWLTAKLKPTDIRPFALRDFVSFDSFVRERADLH
ncbi:MAG: response regulator [Hyphomicrobiaceae bacterium]|jgi:CheY-like chemotaxis protein|nr:response regulator [Hyphomicrobiaceae bacterium]